MEDRKTTTRKSKQRDLVAASVLHRYDHPTAEMVLMSAREVDPKISLATVYRNLDWLVDNGRIEKFVVPGEPDHYDAKLTEHYHACCERCGQIFDIESELSDLITDTVREQAGVDVDEIQIIAKGICDKCKYNNERRSSCQI